MGRKTEYIIQDIPQELLGKKGIVRYNRTVRKSNGGSLAVNDGLIGKIFHIILIPADNETTKQVQETTGLSA